MYEKTHETCPEKPTKPGLKPWTLGHGPAPSETEPVFLAQAPRPGVGEGGKGLVRGGGGRALGG